MKKLTVEIIRDSYNKFVGKDIPESFNDYLDVVGSWLDDLVAEQCLLSFWVSVGNVDEDSDSIAERAETYVAIVPKGKNCEVRSYLDEEFGIVKYWDTSFKLIGISEETIMNAFFERIVKLEEFYSDFRNALEEHYE